MADLTRKTVNLFDVNGETDTIVPYVTIINNGIKFENVPAGNYARITYSAQYTAGTYYISCVASGSDYNAVRLFSDSPFTGATYNSFYGGYYRDLAKSGFSTSLTFDNDFKIGFIANAAGGATFTIYDIMLSTTEADFEPYGWVHSLRKLTTATEAVENPLYSDGTAITAYTIKGNTVQSGTPTPSNPVEVNGVGVRTANLWNGEYETGAYSESTGEKTPNANTYRSADYIAVQPNTQYTFSTNGSGFSFSRYFYYDSNKNFISTDTNMGTITTPNNCYYINFHSATLKNTYPDGLTDNMLTAGSTVPSSYIPYGYKIPISSNGVSYPIYLSEPLMKINNYVDSLASSGTMTRNVIKQVFTGQENWGIYSAGTDVSFLYLAIQSANAGRNTLIICTHFERKPIDTASNTVGIDLVSSGTIIRLRPPNVATDYSSTTAWKQYLADQYAAGTPVTVWYVLATATTESITAPTIPTTDGANTITVDTTVQPSEFTATWTGWHDAYVKEKSENLFDASTAVDGYEITGLNITPNANWYVSDYIPVQVGNTYIANGTGGSCILYDANKTLISSATTLRSTGVTIDTGIAYMRINGAIVNKATAIVNLGTTALPYEPYWK